MYAVWTVLKTVIFLAIVAVVGGYAFIVSGIYDVSASTPDNPYLAWAMHTMSDASVGARLGANVVPSGLDTPEIIAAGGKLYVANCAVCHGAPGVARTAISEGLNPQPADLFRASRKPDQQENFQFIHNGVKMTAMPAFGKSLGADRVWQLVAFLNKLPGISAVDYQALTLVLPPVAPVPVAPAIVVPVPPAN
jgi:mono/diheme cytochrome c family protein